MLGIVYCKATRDKAAAGTACDDCPIKLEHLHELYEICCEIMWSIARYGATSIAVTSLCQGEGTDGLGQMGQYTLKRVPRVCVTMQEY